MGLSFPFALRYRMAYDARLTTDILNVFIRALFSDQRHRARHLPGLASSQCGAVTFVQRFGDAVNSNVHFHCVAIDGAYAGGKSGSPEFHVLPAPEDDEVVRLAGSVSRRVKALLERRASAGRQILSKPIRCRMAIPEWLRCLPIPCRIGSPSGQPRPPRRAAWGSDRWRRHRPV
jgi:Putative transposase